MFLNNAHVPPFSYAATEYHLGLLKAKLAKYRSQLLEPSKSAGATKVTQRHYNILCTLHMYMYINSD